MRTLSLILSIFTSSSAYSIDKRGMRHSPITVSFSHTKLFKKATHDLRTRKLRKIIDGKGSQGKSKTHRRQLVKNLHGRR